MNIYTKLKDLLNSNTTLVVPDAYDGMSARIIEEIGFKAVQCSGYSFSLSKKYKKESLITLDENISITRSIVNSVNVPVFADAEDGYASGDIFLNNITKFVKTGIAGINIEDQNLWSGYTNELLLPLSESINRIKTVKDNFPDLILNARTDALSVSKDKKDGIREAIKRSNAFYENGANLCFITGVSTKEEIKLLKKEIHGPISIAAGLPYNMNNFDISDCIDLEIARVSLPSVMIYAAIKAQYDILKIIKQSGSFNGISDSFIDMENLQSLLK
ncbi:MAG: isocitrate lyase/PEP mutase family protein [Ignavibacteriales bacterium]|nr:isocitrate lyase/PEP mutase family protein [Ignavibacteriales bacterium]